jgi:hypothetical protein
MDELNEKYEVVLIETIGQLKREIKFLSFDDFLKYDNPEYNLNKDDSL